MGLIAFFGIIHGHHCTISDNFYLYLQYFQQKVFNFSKISEFQTVPKPVHFETLEIMLTHRTNFRSQKEN